MRTMLLAASVCAALGGCVVHVRDHDSPSSPPPARTTVTEYGWNHHRYVVWREYYNCSDAEIYYLENCGYDDDDILVCLYLARRARVPLRHMFYEYDRCGRDHYALALSFRMPWDIWFCHEVPRGYDCPPVYARTYGYYWRGEQHYFSNDEIYALVQLQVGVRYYGYSHATYFNEYNTHVQRGERTPFRAIVSKDHTAAGRGGKSWDEQRVVVRNDRPWNAPNPQVWEKQRQAEREQVKIRHTPQREQEEAEQARKVADARKDAHEEAKGHAQEAKARRREDDRKLDAEEKVRGPKPPPARGRDKEPDQPAKGSDREKGPGKVLPPKKGDERVAPPKKGDEKVPPPKKGDEKLPPPKKGDEKVGPPKKGDEKVPPPKKGDEKVGPPKKGDEKVPPPKKGDEKVAPPKEGDEKVAPPKKGAESHKKSLPETRRETTNEGPVATSLTATSLSWTASTIAG